MKIGVDISKKYFFSLLLIGLVLIGIVGVVAFNVGGIGGDPAVFGHSVDEMDWSNPINASIAVVKNISAAAFCIGNICINSWEGVGGGGGGGSSGWVVSGSSIYYNGSGNVGIGTESPLEKLHVNGAIRTIDLITSGGASVAGNLQVGGEIQGGQRCTTWKFDNRAGTTWKYWKFNMPYACEPAHETNGQNWGCTYQIDPEHHSGNVAGVWQGHRSGQFTIWDNALDTGRHYIDVWDYSTISTFDIDSGPGEIILYYHTHDICRGYDSYRKPDGSWVQGHTAGPGQGWQDWGFGAYPYTVCYLKICESPSTGLISGTATATS